jgi:hypothetical protein
MGEGARPPKTVLLPEPLIHGEEACPRDMAAVGWYSATT